MPSSTALLAGLVLSIVTTELVALPTHRDTKKAVLHHRMTKREIAKYFGANSHAEVPEYEVVSPFQADENGEFVTHVLHKRSRSKRTTRDQSFLFYSVNAFGLLLHLNVTKAQPILAPGTMVETIHENGSTTNKGAPKNTFYTGHVVSKPGSTAAISNNNGLTGMINLMNQALFIHPLPSHLAQDYGSASGVQPHLIYKRSLKDVLGQPCNIDTEGDKRGLERNRIRRSSSPEGSPSHKHLEVAMVADDLVVKRHGEEYLGAYLLMLAHLVNNMFHDESVGVKKLNVFVVKLVIKKDGFGYDSSAKNRNRLGLFADWAAPGQTDSSPLSNKNSTLPDIAVLLTGYGFGGIAVMGSTCGGKFGMTVNNDMGLASAIIIAHETAHTFGLGHDGKSARCNDGVYLMSSAVSHGTNAFKWSECSRKLIQDFLAGSGSSCLDNSPIEYVHEPSIFHNKLPGQIVNASLQCNLQFGIEFYACPHKMADCSSLFCTKDGSRCTSFEAPPVDGTRCGNRHWCIKGECVDDGSPMIDGGWSEWQTELQPCSRSCGGGVTWRTRTCTNPVPQNGGEKCQGSSKGLWEMCNTQPCPKGHIDYRLHQCRKFQHTTQVRWEADPCTLACQRDMVATVRGRVKDGTRCSSDPKVHDVCIEGVCKSVGCDLKLNSGLKYDRCAICGGNSSMCSYVHGSYTNQWRRWGPNAADEIVTIPKGSTNIFAQVKAKTRNLLGVKDDNNNWVYRVGYTWSTVVAAAGTRVAYDHRAYLWDDKVEIPGPTKHELKIKYVFIQGRNPGVEYHFFTANKSQVNADEVHWNTGAWELCSEDCAGGYQQRLVECVRKDDRSYVNEKMCIKTQSKPMTKRPCNLKPCAAEWYESGWRPCSQTCGKGIQLRQIVCRRKISQDQYETVNDSSCDSDKPTGILQQDCNKVACPAEWKALAWSECSRSCGGGEMTRSIRCMKRNSYGKLVTVLNHQCMHAPKPITIEECNTDINCPRAIMGSDGKEFIPLGCYKDSNNYRALPEFVANFRGRIDWSKMEKTVQKCAHQVVLKNSTYKVFAIQYYGECWSGDEGEKTYSEYGWSRNCWQGVGGSNTNFVYEFVDGKKNP